MNDTIIVENVVEYCGRCGYSWWPGTNYCRNDGTELKRRAILVQHTTHRERTLMKRRGLIP